ncbi:condensation domain-containing protein, partial [Rugamonas sp. A1-17]|nr:condensation domain-containing protein [Rugamonas sp. A1-17]
MSQRLKNLSLAELAALSSRLGPAASPEPEIHRVARDGVLAPSLAQQRLWFVAQMAGASQAYHMPLALNLSGPVDERALTDALDQLWARHEALRSTFATRDGEPVVVLAAADAGFPLRRHDLRASADAQGELAALQTLELQAAFDLERGPLIRGRLVRTADDAHTLLLTMHHLVSDGWSMGVLSRELGALYNAGRRGQAPLPLPEGPQYYDYADWQRRCLTSHVFDRQAAYWRAQLAGAPSLLELPLDRPRPPMQSFAGDEVALDLGAGLTAELKALSQRHGVSLFMTVLAAWTLVLARLSGQADVVLGIPAANRQRLEFEQLVGFFINTLALRVNTAEADTVESLLALVRDTALGAQQHQDLPFEQIVEMLRPARSLSHTPFFQVMFAWQNNEEAQLALDDLSCRIGEHPDGVAKFDLTLALRETGGRITGALNFATALFNRETVVRIGGYLRQTLMQFVADSGQDLAALSMLSSAERQCVVSAWNDTDAPYARQRCIHELMEAQVARAPAAPALMFGEQTLSYG